MSLSKILFFNGENWLKPSNQTVGEFSDINLGLLLTTCDYFNVMFILMLLLNVACLWILWEILIAEKIHLPLHR